ncbi:MAG: hypothetical protein AB4290_09270 [Spirulina sp.]
MGIHVSQKILMELGVSYPRALHCPLEIEETLKSRALVHNT